VNNADLEERLKESLKQKIEELEYRRYIKNLKLEAVVVAEELVMLQSNNIFTAKWIERKYLNIISKSLETLLNFTPKIKVEVNQNMVDKREVVKKSRVELSIEDAHFNNYLNPSFTFENFIVGGSNQFAYTTAKSVAQNPGVQYNPLFIYGGVGLGKTHLLQAIGNYRAKYGDRVIYTTLEQFMNSFISHLKTHNMDSFRDYFRECDLLLIDDIQFLANKEQTQDEFFHTFNELHGENKQIVMTSDRAPKNIPKLVDRLRSRFEWGLMSDIKPPELDTKISIIKKKCQLDGVVLSDEVIYYLATNMGDNIREIEGSIIKIHAMSSMLNQEITVEFAKNTIKEQLKEKQENITIENIIHIVAKELNIKPSDIKSKKRTRVVVEARRIAIYLSRKLTANTMPQIAQNFGMKDHTTISHAMKKIHKLIEERVDFKVQIEELENKIITFKEQK
jgi:chromosomal replication initiator protein